MAVYDTTGRSSSSGCMYAPTHAWKTPTDRALSDIIFAHSLRYGGAEGDAGADVSNVGGIVRDKKRCIRGSRITSEAISRRIYW